jgi:predicted nucleotidyltransferase
MVKKLGRIFSWEEIIEGKVPTRQDFQMVKKVVREKLINNKKVIGALFIGSILRGDFNERSDVDVLVLHRGDVFPDLRELVSLAKKKFVPLQIIPVEIEMARLGIHTLSEGNFIEHLKWAARNSGIIKENPLKFIKIEKIEPKTVLMTTFGVISKAVAKSICELSLYEGEKKMILLGKLLEAPMHIVTQIIWYKRKENPEVVKKKVIESYCETVRDEKAIRLLWEIISVEEEYSKTLKRILRRKNKKPYEAEYKLILRKIEEIAPQIFEFIKTNILIFGREDLFS